MVLRDRQLKDGQNLPAAYVGPLLSDGPVKLLSEISSTAQENKPSAADIGLAGSYTGVWQSGRFSVSGAAANDGSSGWQRSRSRDFLDRQRLYNKRGTAEQWIKEGKQAVG